MENHNLHSMFIKFKVWLKIENLTSIYIGQNILLRFKSWCMLMLASWQSVMTHTLFSIGYWCYLCVDYEWHRLIRISPFANRLSFDAPPAVQRLRCLANYEALRFSSPILTMGETLVSRMKERSANHGGKYISVHLRFEEVSFHSAISVVAELLFIVITKLVISI